MKQRTGSAASEGRHRGGIAKAHDLHFGVDCWPAEKILSHHDFIEARRVYLDRVDAIYGDDIFLNKLLMEATCTVIFVVIIRLARSKDPSGGQECVSSSLYRWLEV